MTRGRETMRNKGLMEHDNEMTEKDSWEATMA